MGLSIHYSGKIRDTNDIDRLVSEVVDLSESLQWQYHIIESKKDPIRGVLVSPENCEPIFLTFSPDGRICSLISFILKEKYRDETFEPEYTVFTKTQYAGMDTHIAVINLLKYLKEKYFSSFELVDEGYYWETGDKEKLKSRFDVYNRALDIVATALEGMERRPGDSADSLADRIEKLLKKKLNMGDGNSSNNG